MGDASSESRARERPAASKRLKTAVHQESLKSKRGLLERVFVWAFSGLVYPQIWEDPDLDLQALRLGPGHRLMTIASGGCNVMSYLAARPAEILAVDESARCPGAVGVRHRGRIDGEVRGHEGLRRVEALDRMVGLADPVEADRRVARVGDRPARGRRDVRVATRPERVLAPSSVSCSSPDITHSTHSTCAAGSGRSQPPPGSTSTMACEKVVAKPATGRESTHARVPRQCGKRLVTMSRSTPRGMKV